MGLGFGLQKVVSNLISGIILLLDKSIKPGDVIELGPTFGWIQSLGARYVSVVTRDGKEYLDCYSFFASSPLGMNPPDMLEPEFLDRLGRVAVNKVANADFYSQVYAEFVDTVADLYAAATPFMRFLCRAIEVEF